MTEKFSYLHKRAVRAAKTYLVAESELLDLLQKIDHCRGYRELEFDCLSEYTIQALRISANVAYNLIAVARKAVLVPQLKEMIASQEITLSNARTITSVLTPDNADHWLALAARLSKHDLEKEIAKRHPEKAVKDSVRPVAEGRFELKFGISEENLKRFRRVQDLVSTEMRKAASFEDAFSALLDLYEEKKDPLKKAERAIRRRERKMAQAKPQRGKIDCSEEKEVGNSDQKTSQSRKVRDGIGQGSRAAVLKTSSKSLVPGRVDEVSRPDSVISSGAEEGVVPDPLKKTTSTMRDSRYVPAALKHEVRFRLKDQCAFINRDGRRCEHRRWLDIHHVVPLADGGKTELENLTLLCKGHHQTWHELEKKGVRFEKHSRLFRPFRP